MNIDRRLVVILEHGKVVGVQIAGNSAAMPDDANAATALLHAGPGQTRHELTARVPARFATPADRQRFHDELVAMIKAGAKP
jgi:hypothetical protein